VAPGTGKTVAYRITGHIEFISAVTSENLRAVTRDKGIQLMITHFCHSAYALGEYKTLKPNFSILPYFAARMKGVINRVLHFLRKKTSPYLSDMGRF
jgi:hypothetical protein